MEDIPIAIMGTTLQQTPVGVSRQGSMLLITVVRYDRKPWEQNDVGIAEEAE